MWSIVGHRDPTVPDLFHRDKAAIHPHTSQLVYSNSPSLDAPGFSITPIFSRATPRSLPTPAVLPPGKQLSISHDGHWIVVFHPSPAGESGTIAIYPSSILSPTVNPSSVVPLTTLSLSSSPLANQHLYPTHFHTSTSRALQLGPRPPPSHNATRGPTFLLLTTTSLLLFHPHLLGSDPETSLVRDTAPNGSLQQWGMNVLRCPIHTRWHANVGEPPPLEAGPRARRGWIGLMVGEEGVWCAVEIGREVRVLRAEVGSHGSGRYCQSLERKSQRGSRSSTDLQTLPMPPLPRLVPPPFPDAPEVTVETDLRWVVFNFLQDDLKIPVSQTDDAVDSVGVVLVYEDFRKSMIESPPPSRRGADDILESGPTSSTAHSLDIPARTRFETCKFEKREVELVKGFEEIGSGYGDTMTSSWDWVSWQHLSFHIVFIMGPVHVISIHKDESRTDRQSNPRSPPATLGSSIHPSPGRFEHNYLHNALPHQLECKLVRSRWRDGRPR